jgi:LuxR family maltose regulon positive regulatory protein
MSYPLLTTKLYAPSVPPDLVPRPALIERLDGGLRRKLTLISAPAGFGKTTLVAAWVRDAGRSVAWLSLDAEDNDPARFLSYLVAALQGVDPSIGQSLSAMLQSPTPPPPTVLLTALINEMAATPEPFILVLDDYHLIETLPIHQQLGFLLEHGPPQLHMVVVSREDPPLPLPRLRARRQMVEIRQRDLHFSPQEAADFLRHTMGLDLPSADVATLHQRTEGWIAGLQLAALSIRGSDDPAQLIGSFAGSQRYVLDYLVEEVFGQQTPDMQGFLLRTSILDRFSAPLCDAVTGRCDSRDLLLHLERANLFLVPLDAAREWYRYHRLFGDLLAHRLRLEGEEQLPELHQRASRWYADHGFPADAVRYALSAGDWEDAATLIVSGLSGALLTRGEVLTLRRWCQAFPEAELHARPRLCLDYAWALILTEQFDAAEPCLAVVDEAGQASGDAALLGGAPTARAHMARVRGDSAAALAFSERALALLPEDDLSSRSIVAVNLGIAQWYRGRLAEAEQALAEAERAAHASGNAHVELAARVFSTRLLVAQGKLRQAAARFRQIVEHSGRVPVVALALYGLGSLCYEWNQMDAAEDHVRRGIELAEPGGSVELLAAGYGTLGVIAQARGDAVASQAALDRASSLLEQAGNPAVARSFHFVCRTRATLARGDLDAASLAAAQAPRPEEGGTFPEYLQLLAAQAHLLLAQGQREVAAERAAALHAMASHAGWQQATIQARALQAVAAVDHDEALVFLSDALAAAETEGYVRTFLDLGDPMRELLGVAAARGLAPGYVRRLLAAFEGQAMAREPGPSVHAPPLVEPSPSVVGRPSSSVGRPPSSLVEPLSERELEVLSLLAAGQTYREIAGALYVSVNTVKTHLKNVYGKLGVSDRRAAAAVARELGLVK